MRMGGDAVIVSREFESALRKRITEEIQREADQLIAGTSMGLELIRYGQGRIMMAHTVLALIDEVAKEQDQR